MTKPVRATALVVEDLPAPSFTVRTRAKAAEVPLAAPEEPTPVPAAQVQPVVTPPPELPPRDQLEPQIREKAFYRYEERVRQGHEGDHLDDWLHAEREVVDRWHSPLEDLGPPRWDDSPRRSWGK